MTLPHHGSKSPPRKRREDWSDAAWAWDPGPDPALQRRIRRAQRAQRLAQVRADIAASALRHPSMLDLPTDPDLQGGSGQPRAG